VFVVTIEDEDNPPMDMVVALTSPIAPPNLATHVRYEVNKGTQPYGAIVISIKAIRVSLPPLPKHSTLHQIWPPMRTGTLILEPHITLQMR